MTSKLFSFQAFFILAGIHLVAILCGESMNQLAMVTKPLLLLMLIIIFYLQSTTAPVTFRNFVLAALSLSWLGDVLLLFQEQHSDFFLAGLISFLAAHICYILAFNKTSVRHSQTILRQKPWLIVSFIGYGAFFFFLIRNGLGNMLVPVMVYMAVILWMGIAALNRFRRVEYNSFVLVFAGALCFMTSDSLLAINKFATPFPMAGFLIMLTYIAAQYLISKGCLKQIASEHMKTGAPNL
ncbi:MAG: lysoplasmalogenase [Chitinophagales bacterium]